MRLKNVVVSAVSFGLCLAFFVGVQQPAVHAELIKIPPSSGGAVVNTPTPAPTPTPTITRFTYTWTNADIVALGAVLDSNIVITTLPAKARISTAHMVLTGSAAGPTTLTASVGRVAAGYIDLLTAGNMKAAAPTRYGDASAEVGASMTTNGYLTSWTATSDFRIRFLATGTNLDTTTGCSGYVVIDYHVYP